jgi:hypothetical protein
MTDNWVMGTLKYGDYLSTSPPANGMPLILIEPGKYSANLDFFVKQI